MQVKLVKILQGLRLPQALSSSEAMDTVKGCKMDKAGALVVENPRVYKICASTKKEREEWVRCLHEQSIRPRTQSNQLSRRRSQVVAGTVHKEDPI